MIELTYQEIWDAFFEMSGGDTFPAKQTYAIQMTKAFLDEIHASRLRKNIILNKEFREIA